MTRMVRPATLAMIATVALVGCGASTTINGAALPKDNGRNAALPSLSVQQSDVSSDFAVILYPDGDQVAGAPTLDLCSADYPSETLRIARRQVAVIDVQQVVYMSTEAVGYTSAAATQQAFAELRAAAASCPTDFVPGSDPSSTIKTAINPPPDTGWPLAAGLERLAFDVTLTDGSGNVTHADIVYFRRGRILEGVYLYFIPGEPLPAVDGQTTPEAIAGVFADRLAKLAASVVD